MRYMFGCLTDKNVEVPPWNCVNASIFVVAVVGSN